MVRISKEVARQMFWAFDYERSARDALNKASVDSAGLSKEERDKAWELFRLNEKWRDEAFVKAFGKNMRELHDLAFPRSDFDSKPKVKRIRAHAAFKWIRPDEVAECWDGVIDEAGLYAALWDCVERYDNKYRENIEDMGPHDVIGVNCVAKFWKRFDDDQKRALNKLAAQQEA